MRKKITVLVSAFALIGAAIASGSSAATADSASGCVGTSTNYSRTAPIAGGGTSYIYDLPDGETSITVPPAGFDATTAPAAQLQKYGYPAKPTDGSQLATWKRAVSDTPATPGPICETQAKAETSPIWAGYVDKSTSNVFIGAEGDYAIPTRLSSCSNASLADWVGIGGYGTSSLIQAGTAYLQGSTSPVAWFEYLGTNGAGIGLDSLDLNVHAGDSMHIYVEISTSTGQTTFYIANNTTGHQTTVTKTLSVGTYYDGSSAEWVDERLTYGSTPTPLAAFSTVGWSGAQAQHTDASFHSISAGTDHELGMVNGSTLLARPDGGLTSSTSFTDVYHACS